MRPVGVLCLRPTWAPKLKPIGFSIAHRLCQRSTDVEATLDREPRRPVDPVRNAELQRFTPLVGRRDGCRGRNSGEACPVVHVLALIW